MELIKLLPGDKLQSLRHAFAEQDRAGGVGKEQFIRIVLCRLVLKDESQIRIVTLQLATLFDRLDAHSDNLVQWGEFTSYCVTAGLKDTQEQFAVQGYKLAQMRKVPLNKFVAERLVQVMCFSPELQRLLVAQVDMPYLSIFTPNLDFVAKLDIRERSIRKRRKQDMRNLADASAMRVGVLGAVYVKDVGLVVSSTDSVLSVWEYPSLKFRFEIVTSTVQRLLCYCTLNERLYTADGGTRISVWDVSKKLDYPVGTIARKHSAPITCLTVIEPHGMLASSSMDATVQIYDVRTTKNAWIGELKGHQFGIRQMVYSEEHDLMFTAGFDSSALAWDIMSRSVVMKLENNRCALQAIQLVPSVKENAQESVVTVDEEGVFKSWTISKQSNFGSAPCAQTFQVKDALLQRVVPTCIVAMGPLPMLVCATNKLFRFDVVREEGEKEDSFPCSVQFNPFTREIVTAAGRSLKTWLAETGELSESYDRIAASDLTAVCMDPSGKKVMVGDCHGNVQSLCFSDGTELKKPMKLSGEVVSMVYVKQHRMLMCAQKNGDLHILDDSNRDHLETVRSLCHAHEGEINAMAYSEELSQIATASADGVVRLWDFEMVRLQQEIVIDEEITCLAFIKNYPLLMVGDSTGWVHMWALDIENDVVKGSKISHELIMRIRCVYVHEHEKNETALVTDSKHFIAGAANVSSVTAICCVFTQLDGRQELGSKGHDDAVLVTGSEAGEIRLYDITQLLHSRRKVVATQRPSLRADFNPSLRIFKTFVHPQRRQRRKTTERHTTVPSSMTRTSGVSHTEEKNVLKPCMEQRASTRPSVMATAGEAPGNKYVVKLVQWFGHSDEIRDVSGLEELNAISTASCDGFVLVWNFQGELLGTLDSTERHKDQVVRGEVLAPLWKLHVGLSLVSSEARKQDELVSKMVTEHVKRKGKCTSSRKNNAKKDVANSGREMGKPRKAERAGSTMWHAQRNEKRKTKIKGEMGTSKTQSMRRRRLAVNINEDERTHNPTEGSTTDVNRSLRVAHVLEQARPKPACVYSSSEDEGDEDNAYKSLMDLNLIAPASTASATLGKDTKTHKGHLKNVGDEDLSSVISSRYRNLISEVDRSLLANVARKVDTSPSSFLSPHLNTKIKCRREKGLGRPTTAPAASRASGDRRPRVASLSVTGDAKAQLPKVKSPGNTFLTTGLSAASAVSKVGTGLIDVQSNDISVNNNLSMGIDIGKNMHSSLKIRKTSEVVGERRNVRRVTIAYETQRVRADVESENVIDFNDNGRKTPEENKMEDLENGEPASPSLTRSYRRLSGVYSQGLSSGGWAMAKLQNAMQPNEGDIKHSASVADLSSLATLLPLSPQRSFSSLSGSGSFKRRVSVRGGGGSRRSSMRGSVGSIPESTSDSVLSVAQQEKADMADEKRLSVQEQRKTSSMKRSRRSTLYTITPPIATTYGPYLERDIVAFGVVIGLGTSNSQYPRPKPTTKIQLSDIRQVPEFQTSAVKDTLFRMFTALDKDHTGAVLLRDLLKGSFPMARDSDIEKMIFELFQEKEDKSVTLRKSVMSNAVLKEQRPELEELFGIMDDDGSGGVTINQIIEATNKDGTGMVTREDVVLMMSKQGFAEDAILTKSNFVSLFEALFMQADVVDFKLPGT